MSRLSSLLLAAVLVAAVSSALQAQLPVPRDTTSAGTAILYDFEGSTVVTGTIGVGVRIR